MQDKSTKGRDLAYKIATRLRGNEFKDMTLGEIDDFRAEMALFLDLKKSLSNSLIFTICACFAGEINGRMQKSSIFERLLYTHFFL